MNRPARPGAASGHSIVPTGAATVALRRHTRDEAKPGEGNAPGSGSLKPSSESDKDLAALFVV